MGKSSQGVWMFVPELAWAFVLPLSRRGILIGNQACDTALRALV